MSKDYKKERRKKIIRFTLRISFFILLTYWFFHGEYTLPKYFQYKKKNERIRAKYVQTKKLNEDLDKEIKEMKNNKEAIEQKCRTKYNMKKKNEVVVKFIESEKQE